MFTIDYSVFGSECVLMRCMIAESVAFGDVGAPVHLLREDIICLRLGMGTSFLSCYEVIHLHVK